MKNISWKIYIDLLLFWIFFLILKSSRSDVLYRARILNIVAASVEYDMRVLSVSFLFVKLEFM